MVLNQHMRLDFYNIIRYNEMKNSIGGELLRDVTLLSESSLLRSSTQQSLETLHVAVIAFFCYHIEIIQHTC